MAQKLVVSPAQDSERGIPKGAGAERCYDVNPSDSFEDYPRTHSSQGVREKFFETYPGKHEFAEDASGAAKTLEKE